jgi:hypothetical protein
VDWDRPQRAVDAIWNDNRNDPSHGLLYDTYYANSTDDGASFGHSIRLTTRSFDATHLFTARSSGFQTNEYDTSNGIASTNDGAVGAWPDTRNDVGNTGQSDVFAARIGFLPPRCTGSAKSTQDLKRTRLLATTFSCNQPVTVTEDGRVVLSGVPHRAPSKTFRFASRAQSVAAGKSTIIRVRLSRRLVSIIDSALLQHRHIAIIVTLTVTDLDGRRTTLTVLIRRLNVAHLKVPGH